MKNLLLSLLLCLPPLAGAQTASEQQATEVFERFLVAMTNADTDTVSSLFAADALFWGTGSQSLVTTPAGVTAYFEPVSNNTPGATLARAVAYESRALGDNLVMISGVWEILPDGQEAGIPLRVSMLLEHRNGEWLVIQFHNSRMPE